MQPMSSMFSLGCRTPTTKLRAKGTQTTAFLVPHSAVKAQALESHNTRPLVIYFSSQPRMADQEPRLPSVATMDIIHYTYLCVHAFVWRSEDDLQESVLSLTMGAQGIKFRWSGLVAHTFIH